MLRNVQLGTNFDQRFAVLKLAEDLYYTFSAYSLSSLAVLIRCAWQKSEENVCMFIIQLIH